MFSFLGIVALVSGCDNAKPEVSTAPKKPQVSKELDEIQSDSTESAPAESAQASKDESKASTPSEDMKSDTEVNSPKKKGLDYTSIPTPKPDSDAADWIGHLRVIDQSMRELMRAVGSPDLTQDDAIRQAKILSELKLTAAEGLASVAKEAKDSDLAVVAKIEALAHAAGLGDPAAGSKLRLLATQKKEIESPMLSHQANIVLLGFSLSDMAAGLTDSTAVLAQLDQVFDTTEPLQQPDLRISLQTLRTLDQQSQGAAFASAKEKIIAAFRDNKDPSIAMQVWSLDVNDSDEMKTLNETLGNPEIPGTDIQASLDALIKRSPTQWTIAWLLSNVSNIEYSGNIDHASAVIATIESNFSLLTAPQLVAEAEPVIEGFKKRSGMIGQVLDFQGQRDFATNKEFDPQVIQGKITLVDFWATWCGPCRAEFPNLRELYAKYHDQGFEIVGVNLDDMDAEVTAFLENESLPWIHLRSLDQSLEGFANPLSQKISITAIPFMLLLDREGKVIHIHARGKRLAEVLSTYFDK